MSTCPGATSVFRACLFFGITGIPLSRLEGLAKWSQREKGNLEVLKSEWNSDDGYATDESADKVYSCDFPPAEQNPKNIHEYAETALFPSTTSVPNGHKENTPNFHNW